MSRKTLASFARLACFSAAAAACLSTTTACNNEEQSGNLVLNYEFPVGSSACANEGVINIRVTLGDVVETEPCSDTGEFTLNGVPAGNYSDLVVEAVDAEGITIRDNLDEPRTDESVEILGGASQTIDVQLTPTPATVALRLILLDPNGEPYIGQSSSPITSFTVRAIENGSSQLALGEIDVTELESNTVQVPDPERNILGDRLNRVNVRFVAGSGEVVIDADPATPGDDDFLFDPPGPGRLVTLKITCNGDSCVGELEGITGGTVTTGETTATGTGDIPDATTSG